MATSPTQRTLAMMREQGYVCWITEHWNYYAKIRQDLFGFIDILCLKKGEIIGVQTTSYSNVSARVKKINDHDNVSVVRAAGIKIVVHGWHKSGTIWKCRIVDLSEEHKDGE